MNTLAQAVIVEVNRIDPDREHLTFKVGDHVTRGGDDVHVITYLAEDGMSGEFLCVVAPASGWITKGEKEFNMTRRYSRVVCEMAR